MYRYTQHGNFLLAEAIVKGQFRPLMVTVSPNSFLTSCPHKMLNVMYVGGLHRRHCSNWALTWCDAQAAKPTAAAPRPLPGLPGGGAPRPVPSIAARANAAAK